MKSCLDYRKDFPIFEQKHSLVYLDSAATTQKPRKVLAAMHTFYEKAYATVHRGVYSLSLEATENYNRARKKVQSFIHAKHEEEIIFTKGTTHSLNLFARSFCRAFLKPGDIVLLTEIEHHSNLIPWQMMCEEYGIVLRFIPIDEDGEIVFERFLELLQEKNVKLVSLAHVSNVLGTVHPVKEIIEKAHEKGVYVCLDGAQAVAHLPLDVQDLDVDFYAFSGHKIYGPTGVGILYGKKELLEKMPPVEGGGDMVAQVSLEHFVPNPLPLKLEAGTPMIAEVIGLKAALDYITETDREAIYEEEQRLVARAVERLLKIRGVHLLGNPSKRVSLVSFVVDNCHPSDIATLLDCRNIAMRSGHHCSQPTMRRFQITSSCRISFGMYNTEEEVDCFISSLQEVIGLL